MYVNIASLLLYRPMYTEAL